MQTETDTAADDIVESESPSAGPSRVPWFDRSGALFLLFLLIGSCVLVFTLLTVNDRTSEELSANLYAGRSNQVITHWLEHGYFRSGGLMHFAFGEREEPYYYRSSTGSKMITGFIVEKVSSLMGRRYDWRLLAIHNEILTLILAALAGLLAYRLVRRFGLEPFHAAVLAAGAEIVTFTFPDHLAMYWEYAGQVWVLTFMLLFLLLEERAHAQGDEWRVSWRHILVAFLVSYAEFVATFFFFISYAAFLLIMHRGRIRWRALVMKTAVPFGLALLVFALQWTWISVREPEAPTGGSGFMFRSGLDGSTEMYGDHLDIAFGRDLARKTFDANREYLLRWEGLLFGGLAALLFIAIAYVRGRVSSIVVLAFVSLIGSYVLLAAVFSQSVTIHPYLYDVALATPLILALFAVAPALLESMTRYSALAVVIMFFAACGYSMVQLRQYALRYPLAEAGNAGASSGIKAIPYDASMFDADPQGTWVVDRGDLQMFAVAMTGNTMTISFRIVGTSVAGDPLTLLFRIPGGYEAREWMASSVLVIQNGVWSHSMVQTEGGRNLVKVFPPDGKRWTGSDDVGVIGQITFEVQ